MNTNVNYEQLEKDAVEIFTSGFACSESVIWAIRKNLELAIPDDAIAMSSGIPWGMGGAGCLCGAVAGGAMCIGFVHGRRKPGEPVQDCWALTKEFHDAFKKEFGATCCRILIKDYPDRNCQARKDHCISVVKFTVRKVAEILIREETK